MKLTTILAAALSTMTATAALAQTAPQPQQQPAGPPAPPAIQALSEPANRFLRDADIVAGATQSLAAANNSLAGDSREFVQKWQGLMGWAQSEAQQLTAAQKATTDANKRAEEANKLALSRADDLAKARAQIATLQRQNEIMQRGRPVQAPQSQQPRGPQPHPQSPAPR